jgi:putative membrane protein
MTEMAWPVIVAWIHYVAVMLLMASLLGEHVLLKQELTAAEARAVQRLDIIYGGSAALLLVTGIMRIYLEKGVAYYMQSGAFHALLGMFVVVALLSIYPTVVFLRWRAATRAGRGQQLEPGQLKTLQMVLRLEMTLMLVAPFFATWMAHGSL